MTWNGVGIEELSAGFSDIGVWNSLGVGTGIGTFDVNGIVFGLYAPLSAGTNSLSDG